MEHWTRKVVGYTTRTFKIHKNSKGHKESLQKQIDNRSIIKKFLKTIYFVTHKIWAVQENFEEVVELFQELGDEEINAHLREGNQRATYTSIRSVESFIKCLSSFFKNRLLNRLTNAADFSISADETTDMYSCTAVLSIFVWYVNEHHKFVKEFLELTEVVGSKGVEKLCDIIKEVLNAKISWV